MYGISASLITEIDVLFGDKHLLRKVTSRAEVVDPVMPPSLEQTHIDQLRIVPRAGTMPDQNVFDAPARFQLHTTTILG